MGEISESAVYEEALALKPKSITPFTDSTLQECRDVYHFVARPSQVVLDGQSLNLSSVVAVARHGCDVSLTKDSKIHQRLQRSVDVLNEKLNSGETVYGVNTGFGGSADTRTTDYVALQKALIQSQISAVLLPSDRGHQSSRLSGPLFLKNHSIPVPIVRAAMLVRCNSLLRGHSAVRQQVIEYICNFLQTSFTPVVPLKGSISASGDLMPLAYIAGALQGNPDISVHKPNGDIIRADQALKELNLEPLVYGPKEGLGLLNGTAFSCGAASLILFEANQLLLLSQVLTAMGTEAMLGMICNYHPFIAATRPHEGQVEAAKNIFDLLLDSKLAIPASSGQDGLAQDRYALRTSSQWIGPQIENMRLALQQVQTELNSTTDNPLINLEDGNIYHGGNFQAVAITSAMEKTLSTMQMIGKMVFSQCSELLNPTLSNGLPPNLCMEDPSLSFAFKGIDINMAAYTSELGYLNHPISNHVQSAEMHNQALNSLAFIGCRYAGDAVEILSLMTATYLYVLCQAVDLRALHAEFVKAARPMVDELTASACSKEHVNKESTKSVIWEELMQHWLKNSTRDLCDRCATSANRSAGVLLDNLPPEAGILQEGVIRQWKSSVSGVLQRTYENTRNKFLSCATTKKYLCTSSQKLYKFVREDLNVPAYSESGAYSTLRRDDYESIGSQVSKIYTALREERFRDILLSCW
ncbi:hypothetical protein PMG11_05012 [Penicillium brasilianum]|uniref:Phenylalanine ammonia-lyase n=1 Tax=Penicillium brasilianum TaxID=104259 RepID=A0A0F7VEB0_PENBI|nr:hypothetical protein PMG11_05012 [Penicillium brasilianum]